MDTRKSVERVDLSLACPLGCWSRSAAFTLEVSLHTGVLDHAAPGTDRLSGGQGVTLGAGQRVGLSS